MKTLLAVLMSLGLAVGAGAATYEIDAAHSEVGFKVKHMMVGRTAGKFSKFSGTFDYEPGSPKAWKAEALIEAASIDTANADRDKHLRNEDFFDVEKFPTLRFVSSGVEWKGGKGKLIGKLTMHGVTKDVALDLELNGETVDPWGNHRAGFTATTRLDRRDFGILWNKALDKGGLAVGNDVDVTLEIEGVKKQEPKKSEGKGAK